MTSFHALTPSISGGDISLINTQTITFCGYEFTLVTYLAAPTIVIDENSPLADDAYVKALRKVQVLLPYFEAVDYLDLVGQREREELARGYGRGQWKNDKSVLLTIEAYEKELIPVREETYKNAIGLRDDAPLKRETRETVKEPKKPGYVYLLQAASGQYKIGKTSDPKNRARTFGVKLPFQVDFICLIKTDDYQTLEKSLHQRFEAKRIDGKWFNLSDEDVEYIKGLAK
jgi:hypothetical protein